MAKGKWRMAGPDDPIFDGRIIISSHNRPRPKNPTDEAPPEQRYPDLQNLPVDPMEVSKETLKKKFRD